jgi:hypothetical protein
MTQCTASANIMTCAILLLSFTIADAISWLDADIGAPGVAGNHVELNGSLTVTGAGAGATSNGADQLHYTHTNTTDSNLEVTARLVSFSGNRLGSAGIMLRSDNGATAVTASIVFVYQAADSGRHQFAVGGQWVTGYDVGAVAGGALPSDQGTRIPNSRSRDYDQGAPRTAADLRRVQEDPR